MQLSTCAIVSQGLQQGLGSPATPTVLATEAGRLHALALVLGALAQPEDAASEPLRLVEAVRRVRQSAESACPRAAGRPPPASLLR